MTQEDMEQLIREASIDSEGDGGVVQFLYDGVRMACVSDLGFDRMRIVAPIIEAAEITPEQRALMMEANFHTALDGRYATSEGVLYATYIHPLSPLSEDQLYSALRQVAALVRNFGSSYSSEELIFGGSEVN